MDLQKYKGLMRSTENILDTLSDGFSKIGSQSKEEDVVGLLWLYFGWTMYLGCILAVSWLYFGCILTVSRLYLVQYYSSRLTCTVVSHHRRKFCCNNCIVLIVLPSNIPVPKSSFGSNSHTML